ncbi:hypothetical protein DYB28_008167 [Aphanomyces astaci]|uniref:Uncharacterized protein n=1 Tax=Aphanomyces astaci TaxID=112090 RepID=A0A9X8DMB4_APHAT|nr:hypothetical protein DYB28_008167 [Aphanomyces astaci]
MKRSSWTPYAWTTQNRLPAIPNKGPMRASTSRSAAPDDDINERLLATTEAYAESTEGDKEALRGPAASGSERRAIFVNCVDVPGEGRFEDGVDTWEAG